MSPLLGLSRAGVLVLVLGGCAGTRVSRAPGPAARVVVVEREDDDRGPLKVPPGHYPPPGQCRLWFPGRPPGHQPHPGPCGRVEQEAPAGAWVLYRPSREKKVVHARVIDPRRAGVVIAVRVYDADRGTYLGRERP
jgi:hypothetical protein